jgi:hypothetical protein
MSSTGVTLGEQAAGDSFVHISRQSVAALYRARRAKRSGSWS